MGKRTVDEYFAELEDVGEDFVRRKLALGHYGETGDRRATVQLWLSGKDQERRELSEEESRATARSAKKAAWAAAIAAIIAAIAVIVSAVIPYLNQTPS